ncbi:hypothetical protein LX99_00418 [Mucilaginibacter oryzae]|uniref:Uncharacterized protein n=1 Tax=Mucilaginibacter oryzae TaxID=468058 RepID=A0A316HHW5_9SPHI|nr:DUF6169 family protein [Mucilaginibacter oryzae]PWK79957.1 hypothetical protein LX99_00418 [Mucilaginibacter oryzae]
MNSYYSFLKEQDEDGSLFYWFATGDNFVYSVYFKTDEYSQYTQNFPLLLKTGYAFGFRKTPQTRSLRGKAFDPKVFPTIRQIINDFFDSSGNETMLLYHCDTSDKKQEKRSRLFNIWEHKAKVTHLERHAVEVFINETHYCLGFITPTKNPDLESIKIEFNDFAYFIVQEK